MVVIEILRAWDDGTWSTIEVSGPDTLADKPEEYLEGWALTRVKMPREVVFTGLYKVRQEEG